MFGFKPAEELSELHRLAAFLPIAVFPSILDVLRPQPNHFEIVSGVVVAGGHLEAIAVMVHRLGQTLQCLGADRRFGLVRFLAQGNLGPISGDFRQIVVATRGQVGVGRHGRFLEQFDGRVGVARGGLGTSRVERDSLIVGPGRLRLGEGLGRVVELACLEMLDTLPDLLRHFVHARRSGARHGE